MSEPLGQYMTVTEIPRPTAKTRFWEVRDRHGGVLGTIHWYGAWRQYSFFPYSEPVLNSGCLSDLTTFLNRQNDEHRQSLPLRDGYA